MQDMSTSRPLAFSFRTSTYSSYNGNCVEVGEDYRKSSHSVAAGNCAEVGSIPGGVVVRDTIDRDGNVLAFTAEAWAAFTARTARGLS